MVAVSSTRSELPQEPGVVLEQPPDVGDAVLAHRDALDPQPEGEARPLLRIVTDRLEDVGIDHPAAAELHPLVRALDLHLHGSTCSEQGQNYC